MANVYKFSMAELTLSKVNFEVVRCQAGEENAKSFNVVLPGFSCHNQIVQIGIDPSQSCSHPVHGSLECSRGTMKPKGKNFYCHSPYGVTKVVTLITAYHLPTLPESSLLASPHTHTHPFSNHSPPLITPSTSFNPPSPFI
ncbi:hypothetical protein Pmani_014436 [Petrolisthes manimaculis]|uniref:Uncharacterized protein n=1 Tax=Petrolisthes manimaculis TaxID=1843537 RepID=A0AAE1UCN1_9EUCA|nr:hypothetical protein Pmani_014436 [Petrolisthes manimaculis]